MKKLQRSLSFHPLYNKKQRFPFSGHIELTYHCNLNCIHCYCKGSENRSRELTTQEWKKILDTLQEEGCIYLCLSGGDPLVRQDFLELYSYAKAKGFIITLFTNGQGLTPGLIDYLVTLPPFSIEITLNGITQKTYESITQVPGSFSKVMQTINRLKKKKLPFILKSNFLKQNKQEISKIKAFTEQLFNNLPASEERFKCDALIHPRYNGDKTPCKYRLSFDEVLEVKKHDPDMWRAYQEQLSCKLPRLRRKRQFLYQCNSCARTFRIDPYGYLSSCHLQNKFSINLKTLSFRKGFYGTFPKILNKKFKTNSKCKNCRLRVVCYYCPARAYLETGNEEGPVPYYCQLARPTYKYMKRGVSKGYRAISD